MTTIPDYKRELTIDLFLHTGTFWREISAMRERWRIAALTAVPPPNSRPVADSLPRPDSAETNPMQWYRALCDLHDHVIPHTYRYRRFDVQNVPSNAAGRYRPTWRDDKQTGGALLDEMPNGIALSPFLGYPEGKRARLEYQTSVWLHFLANCVLYDPPDDKLEEFAQAASGIWDDRKTPSLPIVWLADPVETLEIERQYWEAKHQMLVDRFDGLLGFIAEQGLQDEYSRYAAQHGVGNSDTSFGREYHERVAKIEVRPYISVEDDPDDEVVKEAARVLRGGTRTRGRNKRDRLRALQCYVWKEYRGWSDVQIAEHYGWTISEGNYPEKGDVRSEKARQYVADGREILQQRKTE